MHSLITRFATVALGCAGFVGVAASRARAQACSDCFTSTQTFQCTIAPAVPSAGLRTCNLPSFDTNLGVLQSVTVSASLVAQEGRFQIENLDPSAPCPGDPSPNAWFVESNVQFFEPSLAPPLCTQLSFGACSGHVPPLPPFDGTIDFGVAGGGNCPSMHCFAGSGYTFNCDPPPPTSCPSVCITDPSRLLAYKSAGPGQVQFSFASNGSFVHQSSCGSVIVALRLKVGANVSVTYSYRPVLAGTAFCFGDGSLATACPCAPPDFVPNPSGAPDAGCANSFSLAGAKLLGLGTLAPDSLRLVCSIGTNYAGYAFLVKGGGVNAAGVATGDGVRCADGALIRFGGHNAGSFGAALGCWSYPNTAQTTPVSVATSQPAGQTARYQLVYRNSVPGFCSPATTNISSGVQALWP